MALTSAVILGHAPAASVGRRKYKLPCACTSSSGAEAGMGLVASPFAAYGDCLSSTVNFRRHTCGETPTTGTRVIGCQGYIAAANGGCGASDMAAAGDTQ